MANMTLKDRLHVAEEWILAPPSPQAGGPLRLLHHFGRIAYAVIRDVISGNLTLYAMSLVYTTMLSVVPLLALSFSVLKALGLHSRIEPMLYQFFEPLGPRGVEMADKMLSFVDNIKVGVLGSLGLALLVYTVISLVQKIERSFNQIWRVPQMRSMSQRFSNYLSVIMVGPLLMVSAVGVTATIFSSSIVQWLLKIEPFGSLIVLGSKLVPFLLVVGAFTFVYTFMPNTRVRLRSALLGGVLGGMAWQAGGVLFASFVVGSSRYEAIYSSFAIGIVLLIWVYISWLILLIGSSIAFYDQYQGSISRNRQVKSAPELEERVALALMWLVAKPFDRGEKAPQQEALEHRIHIPAEITRRISDKLIRGGLITLAGPRGDQLVPARSLDQMTLADVLAVVRADEEGLVGRLPTHLPSDHLLQAEASLQETLQTWVRQAD
ncbi:YihY/virulence factor BrkB family protein [Mangrovitalea sediminis]|uniref:YihY/virulence factor BrkB family protein n=1 Tax=Mangrovitalea sediminis TaxID=1982043 RepID=UPI000BE619AC|nr:YihY/virulence factor BrkB family protein [Mangrovitalea sediminis]